MIANCKKKMLQSLLQEKHIVRSEAEACANLVPMVRCIINELLDEIEAKDIHNSAYAIPRNFIEEINQHISFCQKAASCSINRDSSLAIIKR